MNGHDGRTIGVGILVPAPFCLQKSNKTVGTGLSFPVSIQRISVKEAHESP